MVGNKPTSTQLSRASAAANDQQRAKEIPKIPYSGHFTAGDKAFARDSDSSSSNSLLRQETQAEADTQQTKYRGRKGFWAGTWQNWSPGGTTAVSICSSPAAKDAGIFLMDFAQFH